MENNGKKPGIKFLLQWILANGIGWLGGSLGTFILSYFVVNIYYDKETNLIAGLCLGGGIGFAHWIVLKKWYKISPRWILISTLCLGIPVILVELMNDIWQVYTNFYGDLKILGRLLNGLILGSAIGLLQMPLLRPFFKKAPLWIPGSSIGWGVCSVVMLLPMPFATIVVLVGGFLLGAITGLFLMWMR